jgi:hypothetical protein
LGIKGKEELSLTISNTLNIVTDNNVQFNEMIKKKKEYFEYLFQLLEEKDKGAYFKISITGVIFNLLNYNEEDIVKIFTKVINNLFLSLNFNPQIEFTENVFEKFLLDDECKELELWRNNCNSLKMSLEILTNLISSFSSKNLIEFLEKTNFFKNLIEKTYNLSKGNFNFNFFLIKR